MKEKFTSTEKLFLGLCAEFVMNVSQALLGPGKNALKNASVSEREVIEELAEELALARMGRLGLTP